MIMPRVAKEILYRKSDQRFELLIATHNPGKATEIQDVLSDLPINWRFLTDFPDVEVVEETGNTYEDNAGLKARVYARKTGLWALADDSGLEVEALNGAPGILSARYGGGGESDEWRLKFLLEKIKNVPAENRRARFICAVAVANNRGDLVRTVSAFCRGKIVEESAGEGGFGYDPIFVPDGFGQTFAELPLNIKHEISHRGKALALVRDFFAGTWAQ